MTQITVTHSITVQLGNDGPVEPESSPNRLHVALFEPDISLRSVLTRTLIRAGHVVILLRSLEQAAGTLADADADVGIVALDEDLAALAGLVGGKSDRIRLIVLSYRSPDPVTVRQMSSVHFLRKPFDAGALLALMPARKEISV